MTTSVTLGIPGDTLTFTDTGFANLGYQAAVSYDGVT